MLLRVFNSLLFPPHRLTRSLAGFAHIDAVPGTIWSLYKNIGTTNLLAAPSRIDDFLFESLTNLTASDYVATGFWSLTAFAIAPDLDRAAGSSFGEVGAADAS